MPLDKNDLLQIQSLIEKALDKKIANKPAKNRTKKPFRKSRTIKNEVKIPNIKKLPSSIIANDIDEETINTRRSRVDYKKNVGENKGQQCRTEGFRAIKNRPNIFLKSSVANSFKQDTVIDKKLSGKLELTPRRGTVQMYEVECSKCGTTCIVSADMVMIDSDTNTVNYTCDRCIRR